MEAAVPPDIWVRINGMAEKVPSEATLADLMVRFHEEDPDLIVELNGRFVFPREYAAVRVAQNDRVEFIHPHFGG